VLITSQEKRSLPEWRDRDRKGIPGVWLVLPVIASAALCLTGLTGVTAASAAPPAGSALAWGDNGGGQLGNGGIMMQSNLPVPVDLPAGTGITAISAVDAYSIALTVQMPRFRRL